MNTSFIHQGTNHRNHPPHVERKVGAPEVRKCANLSVYEVSDEKVEQVREIQDVGYAGDSRRTHAMNIQSIAWQCLDKAIDRFNNSTDCESLLCPRSENGTTNAERSAASERAITHRLAYFLECELRSVGLVSDCGPIVVDCEYNRHISDEKLVAAIAALEIWEIVKKARRKELEANNDGDYVFCVAPDIVVHQRRTDINNLLVIEAKKRSNPEAGLYDCLKLELFTASKNGEKGYGYRLGARVVAEDEFEPEKRCLVIDARYEDGRSVELTSSEPAPFCEDAKTASISVLADRSL